MHVDESWGFCFFKYMKVSELSTKKKYQIIEFVIKINKKTVSESRGIATDQAPVAITSLGRMT